MIQTPEFPPLGVTVDIRQIIDPSTGAAAMSLVEEGPRGEVHIPVETTLALDPAFSGSEKSAYNGITVVATDPWNCWWVMEALRLRARESDVAEQVLSFVVSYGVKRLAFESVAAQVLYRTLIGDRFRAAGIHCEIVEYHESSRMSKMKRIRALEPRFRRGKIRIRRGLDDLYDEMRKFPQTQYFDLLDSLAQHLELARPPRVAYKADKETEEPPIPGPKRYSRPSAGMGAAL